MPIGFNGQLNHNRVINVLYNMIISINILDDNLLRGKEHLSDRAKVDGSMYGDTKLYIGTDVLVSKDWGADSEASNLLALHRPPRPSQQTITINKYRQVCLTIDNYLTKNAFKDEGTFMRFNSQQVAWLSDTKLVYEQKLYDAFIGTTIARTAAGTKQNPAAISLPDLTDGNGNALTGANLNAAYNLRALKIAETLENIFDEMEDASRDYNDWGNLRSYGRDSLMVIMNNKYANEFRLVDLPAIFHNENILPKVKKLLAKYFGTVTTTGANASGERSLIENDFNTVAMDDANYDKTKHIFPGDLWPSGVAYAAGDTYTVDDKVICKIVAKLPPLMSAFVVETSFFNAKSLTESRFLTWGYNTLETLANYPFVTIKEA